MPVSNIAYLFTVKKRNEGDTFSGFSEIGKGVTKETDKKFVINIKAL